MDLSKLSTEDLRALQAGDLSKVSTQGLQELQASHAGPVSPPEEKPLVRKALEPANAVASGFWRGMTGLGGLPMDTAQNVIDLVKVPLGMGYSALNGGKSAPDWLQIQDRSNLPGSSAWLQSQLRKTALGRSLIDPANPEYEGGYLQAGGTGLTAIQRPGSLPQLLNQGALGVTGAMGGKAAYDLTGDPSAAILASMAPAAAQMLAVGATKRAVRGGEEGRQNMRRRIQEFRNAGIERPTLGLASGNETIGGAENLLQSTPGAMTTMRKARENIIDGMRRNVMDAADTASVNRGPDEAGRSIRRDIRGPFMERFKGTQEDLYNTLGNYLPPGQKIPVPSTESALHSLTTPSSGAPNVSGALINPRIASIRAGFDADTGSLAVGRPGQAARPGVVDVPDEFGTLGVPNPRYVDPAFRGAGGTAAGGASPGGVVPAQRRGAFSGVGGDVAPEPMLPYDAVKGLRTRVGDDLSNELVSGVPNSQTKRLYAGLTEDMKNAAETSGGGAAWKRANDYTRAGMDRLERLGPYAGDAAPEKTFESAYRTLDKSPTTFQAIKKSVTPETRAKVAATVIEDLGVARSGQQNAAGDVWSPETFLTNWNNLSAKGRNELFSGFPNAAKVRAEVEAAAKAAERMRANSKIWANPSGTSAATTARLTLGSVPATAAAATMGLGSWMVPAGLVGGLGLTRGAASFVTNPRVVDSFANRTQYSPATQGGLLANYSLLPGLLAEDPK